MSGSDADLEEDSNLAMDPLHVINLGIALSPFTRWRDWRNAPDTSNCLALVHGNWLASG
jgi:hypothetical protein